MEKDEELVMKVKVNDEESFEILVSRYRPLILSIFNQFNKGVGDYLIDSDDILQEGCIALYQACRSYDESYNVKFVTYAYTVIKRRIIKMVKQYGSIYSSEGKSIDTNIGYDMSLCFASDGIYENPERYFSYKNMKTKMNQLYAEMSDEETAIIRLRKKDKTYQNIADELSITPRRVDYQIQKIRRRIKDTFENEIVVH
ncbi:MAG: sigma-70 family RNA polymerase sigma factor [Firmicutes bacterium]|nr:sigma-70 family RNA polymerase sigma factor [Bacillota bacterium]